MKNIRFSGIFIAALLTPFLLVGEKVDFSDNFLKKELQWRAARDRQMRSPSSWLTIAGLFWLNDGENSFGSAEGTNIQLPGEAIPHQAGTFFLDKNRSVSVSVHADIPLLFKGKKISRMKLAADDSGNPDILELGTYRMWVIKRNGRTAIRLRDLNRTELKKYSGLEYFSPDIKYKIPADFFPYDHPRTVIVPTAIDTEAAMKAVGIVHFRIEGKEYRLMAFGNKGPDALRLFIIFSDKTNGRETYEAGRFLNAEVDESGKTILNFNRAVTPPCAYTPYATCPMPPPENYLDVRIPAGEKKYPGGHH